MGLLSKAAGKSVSQPQGAAASEESVGAKIARFHRTNAVFNCILLNNPAAANEEDDGNFCQRVSEMVHKAGIVIPLPAGRPLILLPKALDRELIAHRLSKSLNTAPILSFEADSPESALSCLQSLS